MTVWIDQPAWPAHGTLFAHLASDAGYDELHAMARAAGLDPRSFDGDHYDVPQRRYADCLAAGAHPTTGADLVRRLNASGLRLRKRKGERGVARILGWRFPDDVSDVDLVVSRRPAPPDLTGMAMCFVRDRDGRFALAFAPRRQQWGAPGGWREAGETVAEGAAREVLEECGLVVDADALEPVGWERFTPGGVATRVMARPYLQLYAVTLPESAPPLRAEGPDVPPPYWADLEGYRRVAGDHFYWPVVDRLFGPRRVSG